MRARRVWLAAAIGLLGSVVGWTAWIDDDIWITLRTVDNLRHGFGLTWNAYERVQAYTHPLWMLVLCVSYFLTGEAFFSTLVISMACTLGVLYLAWRRWRATPHKVVALALLLLASKAYVDFSTSGLENPLTHLIAAAFFTVLLDERGFPPRRFLTLVAIASLGYVNRADSVLATAPALLWVTWQERRKLGRRLIGLWSLGLTPALAWTAFGVIYYGFPVPNTAFAKLAGGHYHGPFFHPNGIAYFGNSLRWDPVTLPLVASAFAFALARHRWKKRPLVLPILAGALLLVAYAMRIGGDYMSGRLFAFPFLLASLVIVELVPEKPIPVLASAFVVGLVGICGPRSPFKPATMAMRERDATAIIDDRALHNPSSFNRVVSEDDFLIGVARRMTEPPPQAVIWGATGYHGYQRGPYWRTIDNLGLSDPLIARLRPNDAEHGWGRGHLFRDVPAGYLASVETGQNRIVDPSLHAYYDKLLIITTGPIFTTERFRTIWAMNTGAYGHLLDEYDARTRPP